MADACARAFAYTGDPRWADGVRLAAQLVRRTTTTSASPYSTRSPAGGFDGLEQHGVNRNQGAESTLAFVATMAQADRLRRQLASGSPIASGGSRAPSRR